MHSWEHPSVLASRVQASVAFKEGGMKTTSPRRRLEHGLELPNELPPRRCTIESCLEAHIQRVSVDLAVGLSERAVSRGIRGLFNLRDETPPGGHARTPV